MLTMFSQSNDCHKKNLTVDNHLRDSQNKSSYLKNPSWSIDNFVFFQIVIEKLIDSSHIFEKFEFLIYQVCNLEHAILTCIINWANIFDIQILSYRLLLIAKHILSHQKHVPPSVLCHVFCVTKLKLLFRR